MEEVVGAEPQRGVYGAREAEVDLPVSSPVVVEDGGQWRGRDLGLDAGLLPHRLERLGHNEGLALRWTEPAELHVQPAELTYQLGGLREVERSGARHLLLEEQAAGRGRG